MYDLREREQPSADRHRLFGQNPIKSLRNEISQSLNQIEFNPNWDFQLFGLFFTEMLYLQQLKTLLNKPINKEAISLLFASRWDDIRNTPFCYTLNPHSRHNQLYRKLSEVIFGEHKNSRLMPTLPKEDIYTNELDNMKCGEIILTDKGQDFIHIPSLIETVIGRYKESDDNCLITYDKSKDTERLLSSQEISRIITLHPMLDELFKLLRGTEKESLNVLIQLQKLSNGLKNGDLNHKGTDEICGYPASVATINFVKYWDQLSDEKRKEISELKNTDAFDNTFEILLKSLTEPKEGFYYATCVQVTALSLNKILLNELANPVLKTSITVKKNLSRLLEIQENFNLALIFSEKNTYSEENLTIQQGKFNRDNWGLYYQQLNVCLTANERMDDVQMKILKNLIFIMAKHFPTKKSHRRSWANVFIALNTPSKVQQNVNELGSQIKSLAQQHRNPQLANDVHTLMTSFLETHKDGSSITFR